ncbi:hypothetical protein niasHS_003838 [Heterodera schachtii]|uniref:Conserved oligomeric Golgi complex subunit 6 n=1 Tax=Heterodera schachtii TaxID=97005 RepID=A0ABD2K3S1_HETSC
MSLEGDRGGIDALLTARLDEDEQFIATINYLNDNLRLDAETTEQKLRMVLEDRELELNQQYLEQLEKMNDRVQGFVQQIRSMNSICCELTERIQTNKEKTRELLKRTAVLQTEKRELGAKKAFLDEFFAKYSLNEEEEMALALPNQQGSPSDAFFSALRRLLEVEKNVTEQLALEPNSLALMELSHLLGDKLRQTYATLYACVQRECRLLNVEFLDLKPALVHSFELLHRANDGEMFGKALDDYGNARRGFIVRAFIDTLTRGVAKSAGPHGPIEQLATDPLRYVNEMLSWIQHTVAVEKEMLAALLRDCTRHGGAENVPAQARAVLTSIAEAMCQPLRLRVEQCITKEGNCVVLNRLANLLLFYVDAFKEMLSADAHLVLCCSDLHELCSNMRFSAVSSSVQRILATARVPDYDLLPVQSVNQALLLLRDILEAQNDGAFAAVQDKRSLYNKIFTHILDPLLQSIQLVCSNLDDPMDVAVYMLNCLNAIRSVVILYQFTDAKLEMIKAQIEANEDVLVSEQASKALVECDMLELYTKAQAHQANQGPLSKIPNMEPSRVRASFIRFEKFLDCPESYNCPQMIKISAARIRESIQRRTFEHIVGAYRLIWEKVTTPENEYQQMEQMRSVEEVEKTLLKK